VINRRARPSALLLLAAAVAGCAPSRGVDETATQAPTFYVPGLPYFYSELDVELPQGVTIDTVRPDLQVNLRVFVPNASLSFVKVPDGYLARFELSTRVVDPETGDLLREREWSESTLVAAFEQTRLYAPHLVIRSVTAPPGRYDLEIRVTDLDNRKQAARRHRVEVADLRRRPVVTGMNRLESRRPDGTWEPAYTGTVRRSADSLRLAATVLTLAPPITVAGGLTLLRVSVDTAAALPPYANPPTGGGTVIREFVGIGAPDTVFRTRWRMEAAGQQTTIRVMIPPLPEGVYRMDVEGTGGGPRLPETEFRWSRWYVVRSQEYPRPATLDEVAAALQYIATEQEWRAIDSVTSPRERKRRFDQFWLSIAGSGPAAANLLKAYYTRVQEANLFFSGHKEGWRSDRGMVYIVMGPPPVVERRLDQEVWRYGASEEDALQSFAFRRGTSGIEGAPFENYVLQRQYYYDRIWLRMVERWRTGRIF